MRDSKEMFENLVFALHAAATEVKNIGDYVEEQRTLLNDALFKIDALQQNIDKDKNTKEKIFKILKEELYGKDGEE